MVHVCEFQKMTNTGLRNLTDLAESIALFEDVFSPDGRLLSVLKELNYKHHALLFGETFHRQGGVIYRRRSKSSAPALLPCFEALIRYIA